MKRMYRATHRRIWWVLGPGLVLVVLYGALFPSVTPVSQVPSVLQSGGSP